MERTCCCAKIALCSGYPKQAWRALRRAPGRDRRFGFERWNKRPPEIDRALALARTEAREIERIELPTPIAMSDWHQDAVDAATTCVAQAGLAHILKVERVDARKAPLPVERPIICSNLPFGERLGGDNRLQLEGFYRTLGERLRGVPGARVLMFSAYAPTRALLNLDDVAVRSSKWRLKSGPLGATLYRWDVHPTAAPVAVERAR